MTVEHTSVEPGSHTCPGHPWTFKKKPPSLRKFVVIGFLLTCMCTRVHLSSPHWPPAHTNPLRFWVRHFSGFCESPKKDLYCYRHYINKVELNWIKLNPVPRSTLKSIMKKWNNYKDESIQSRLSSQSRVCICTIPPCISLSNVSIHWIKNDPGDVLYCPAMRMQQVHFGTPTGEVGSRHAVPKQAVLR